MLESHRLILRPWLPKDYLVFRCINQDPLVMRYFPALLNDQESDSLAERLDNFIQVNGWGFWALELKQTGSFIGFVGLYPQGLNSGIPNAPLLEIGWRICSQYWGHGYAPEAANLALRFAFEQLKIDRVYAFTSVMNLASIRVMEKIGMCNALQDFDHPKLPKQHELARHCLYEIDQEQWQSMQES